MGCFGFICKHCGTPIRENENCVLIHVRHGEELGRAEGHYDSYGRVIEQRDLPDDKRFRSMHGTGLNSHVEICASEYNLSDSYYTARQRRRFGKMELYFSEFFRRAYNADFDAVDGDITKLPYISFIENTEDGLSSLDEWRIEYAEVLKAEAKKERLIAMLCARIPFETLMSSLELAFYLQKDRWYRKFFDLMPAVTLEKYSGMVAYHKRCYDIAVRKGTFSLIPSEYDPNQSWGRPRKRFI